MENKKGRDSPCLSGNRSALLLAHLVHLPFLLLRLFRGFLLVHLFLHLVLVLRDGGRRRKGGRGHGGKHRRDDHGQQLAHFVLLVSVRKWVDATSRALPGASNAPPEARVDRRSLRVCRNALNHCFLKTVAAV